MSVTAAWGNMQEEALRNIQAVAQTVVEQLMQDGERIPTSDRIADGQAVAVNIGEWTDS